MGPQGLWHCPQSRGGPDWRSRRRPAVPAVWAFARSRQDCHIVARCYGRCHRFIDCSHRIVALAALEGLTLRFEGCFNLIKIHSETHRPCYALIDVVKHIWASETSCRFSPPPPVAVAVSARAPRKFPCPH